MKNYQRSQAAELARRLSEPRRFIQVVAGPRQTGKTTLVQQVTETLDGPVRYASAASLIPEPGRWSRSISDSLIETSYKDVLLFSRGTSRRC
jgi:AAA+ ATPase superfamily predicted ATPase